MSFAKQFIKAAAENVEMAAEQLADKVKSERFDYDQRYKEIPPIKEAFQKVVGQQLPTVASVQFIEEQMLVDTGHEGTAYTHQAVNRAYEKLQAEELIPFTINVMDKETVYPKETVLTGRPVFASSATWDAYEEDKLKQALRLHADRRASPKILHIP